MKTIYIFLALLLFLIAIPVTAAGIHPVDENFVISITSDYVNKMNETWNVTTSDLTKPLVITYTIGTESNFDWLTINNVDNFGNVTSQLLKISGTQSGTISTLTPNGRVQVVFTSDDSYCYVTNPSIYSGINVSFAVNSNNIINNSLQVTGNSYVTGKLGIGTYSPTTPLDVYGNATFGTNYKIKVMDFPGQTSWIDMPIATSKACGIGTGGPGQNAWIGYAGLANQWFTGSSAGDVCYRNSAGKLLFGNTSTYVAMAITGNNVGIGTMTPRAALDVAGSVITSGSINATNEMIVTGSGADIGGTVSITNTAKTSAGQASTWRIYNMSGSYGNSLQFWAYDNIGCVSGGMCASRLTLMDNGNIITGGKIGIGLSDAVTKLAASPSDELLTVNGTIHAKEVKVDLTGSLADYVFNSNYTLMPLCKVEQYVKTNSRLPELPSAEEVKRNGLSLGEMQNKLLQKIEELTLYVIGQQKKIDELEQRLK